MTPFDLDATVGRLVAERPARARVFERFGIDYRGGGRVSLALACKEKGLDPGRLARELEALTARDREAETDESIPAALGELVDFIVSTHHALLRRELPRLRNLAEEVARAHARRHPELWDVRDVFDKLQAVLMAHTEAEERAVFPLIKAFETGEVREGLPRRRLEDAIGALKLEHNDAGAALSRLSALTRGYAPPPDACGTYRAFLSGLAELQADTHHHVHRENQILFPGALAVEGAC